MIKPLKILLVILLSLGLLFRFLNLEKKVYWHDEVYTTIRATGNRANVFHIEEFQNKIVSIEQLQKYQQLKLGSSDFDTIDSLINEDPHHPPLYFLLNRYWGKLFGFSITSSRVLPIIISLISLPLMYLLALELFNSKLVGYLATLFLFFSPFDIIFSQIARQYSLVTLFIILSSLFLLKATKYGRRKDWVLYTIIASLGWYTHLFFGVTIIAQGVFILVIRQSKKIVPFSLSLLSIILLYLPWLLVLFARRETAISLTDWAKARFDIILFSKQWILSFSSLFTDLFFGFDNPLTYLYRLLFIGLIFWAIIVVYRTKDLLISGFIITSIVVPFFLLVIPDLIFSTLRSTITRYLISSYPAVQLAVAYLFYNYKNNRIWQLILVFVLTNSLVSGVMNVEAETSWAKLPSYYNKEVTKVVNQSSNALIVSDRGDGWINIGDVLSLSYHLNKDVKFLLASYPDKEETVLGLINTSKADVFVFRPSEALKTMLEKNYGLLEPINLEAGLYKIKP